MPGRQDQEEEELVLESSESEDDHKRRKARKRVRTAGGRAAAVKASKPRGKKRQAVKERDHDDDDSSEQGDKEESEEDADDEDDGGSGKRRRPQRKRSVKKAAVASPPSRRQSRSTRTSVSYAEVDGDVDDDEEDDGPPRREKGGSGKKKKEVDAAEDKKEGEEEVVSVSDDSGDVEVDGGAAQNERQWVQCDKCEKWRICPVDVDPEIFKSEWTCDMNTWNVELATCDAPEEVEDTAAAAAAEDVAEDQGEGDDDEEPDVEEEEKEAMPQRRTRKPVQRMNIGRKPGKGQKAKGKGRGSANTGKISFDMSRYCSRSAGGVPSSSASSSAVKSGDVDADGDAGGAKRRAGKKGMSRSNRLAGSSTRRRKGGKEEDDGFGNDAEQSSSESEGSSEEEEGEEYKARGRGKRTRTRGRKAVVQETRRSSRQKTGPATYSEDAAYAEAMDSVRLFQEELRKKKRVKRVRGDDDDGGVGDVDAPVDGERRRKNRDADGGDDDDDVVVVDDGDTSSSSDSGNEADGDYVRLAKILARRTLKATEWGNVCQNMNTSEITRGSLWIQEDSELAPDSAEPIEKFLCKWQDMSYLHVSWETVADLSKCVGAPAKAAIKRFVNKEAEAALDLSYADGEYFDPVYLEIDRVLDIESVEVKTDGDGRAEEDVVEKEKARDKQDQGHGVAEAVELAEGITKEEQREADGEMAGCHVEKKEADDEVMVVDRAVSSVEDEYVAASGNEGHDDDAKKPVSAPPTNQPKSTVRYLIKWTSLPYTESTWEKPEDLKGKGIDAQIEAYYRRQVVPDVYGKKPKRTVEPDDYKLEEQPEFKGGGTLREYQWEAVRWMVLNWSVKKGSILADEMGLGKTVQTVAFVNSLYAKQDVQGPFLVVAPLSTLQHWKREFETWTDLNVIMYHGKEEDREIMREREFWFAATDEGPRRSKSRTRRQTKFQVLITSPEMCIAADRRELSGISWAVLVIDEAHRLKNHEARLSVVLREEFTYDGVLLLTGTPIQNTTEELWALLNLSNPTAFSNRDNFMAEYGEMKEQEQADKLQAMLRNYLLRRVKHDVEKGLPPKEETIIDVELTSLQKQYYRALYEKNVGFLYHGKKSIDGPSLMNLCMELRKCCNHLFLLKGVEADVRAHALDTGKTYTSDADLLVESSGKLVLLDKLLPKLKANGHRVLIFSQFKIMLDLLEDYLMSRSLSFGRIDGSITGDKRQAAIDAFSHPDSTLFSMLLSTRAGGVGINLTAADTVIIMDSDWNPQNDIQAQARCHRIGQQRAVKIYRLITAKTYEQAMFHKASLKLGLDQAVLQTMEAGAQKGPQLTKAEIEQLLKNGAYDVFREEREGTGDDQSKRFCEADIEQILADRAHTIVHDSGATQPVGRGTFNKASFSLSMGADAAVDINDPDFWSKVVGIKDMQFAVEDEPKAERRAKQGRKRYTEADVVVAQDVPTDSSSDEEDVQSDEGPSTVAKAALSRLVNALGRYGYSSKHWSTIAEEVKLKPHFHPLLRTIACHVIAATVRAAARQEARAAKLPPKTTPSTTGASTTSASSISTANAQSGGPSATIEQKLTSTAAPSSVAAMSSAAGPAGDTTTDAVSESLLKAGETKASIATASTGNDAAASANADVAEKSPVVEVKLTHEEVLEETKKLLRYYPSAKQPLIDLMNNDCALPSTMREEKGENEEDEGDGDDMEVVEGGQSSAPAEKAQTDSTSSKPPAAKHHPDVDALAAWVLSAPLPDNIHEKDLLPSIDHANTSAKNKLTALESAMTLNLIDAALNGSLPADDPTVGRVREALQKIKKPQEKNVTWFSDENCVTLMKLVSHQHIVRWNKKDQLLERIKEAFPSSYLSLQWPSLSRLSKYSHDVIEHLIMLERGQDVRVVKKRAAVPKAAHSGTATVLQTHGPSSSTSSSSSAKPTAAGVGASVAGHAAAHSSSTTQPAAHSARPITSFLPHHHTQRSSPAKPTRQQGPSAPVPVNAATTAKFSVDPSIVQRKLSSIASHGVSPRGAPSGVGGALTPASEGKRGREEADEPPPAKRQALEQPVAEDGGCVDLTGSDEDASATATAKVVPPTSTTTTTTAAAGKASAQSSPSAKPPASPPAKAGGGGAQKKAGTPHKQMSLKSFFRKA